MGWGERSCRSLYEELFGVLESNVRDEETNHRGCSGICGKQIY